MPYRFISAASYDTLQQTRRIIGEKKITQIRLDYFGIGWVRTGALKYDPIPKNDGLNDVLNDILNDVIQDVL